jgi:hypothetical protein
MDFLGDNGDIHVLDFLNKLLDLIHFQQSLNMYRVLPLYITIRSSNIILTSASETDAFARIAWNMGCPPTLSTTAL